MVLRQSAPPVSLSKEPTSQFSWLRKAVEAYRLRRTLHAYEVREVPLSSVATLLKKSKPNFLRAPASEDIARDKQPTDGGASMEPIDHPSDWYEVEEIKPPGS